MKAFRNTGVEGGYGSLATQNWLLARRREQQRFSRVTGEKTTPLFHKSGKSHDKPVKTPPVKGVKTKWIPLLIEYFEAPFKPIKLGSTGKCEGLVRLGLLQCVDPPDRYISTQQFGDTYLITKAGREYCEFLKQKA